ncbi:MAG: ABC transporter permease [Prevotellaceae bacterium]|jgi:ABC-2 type transport system permease protein|nr:ABC transporter permease [Prevotellaceae bacterium]
MKKTLLVIKREFIIRVKKKSFIIMTVLVPLLFACLAIVPALISQIKSDKDKVIVVLDDSGIIADKLENAGTIKFVNDAKPIDSLKNDLLKNDNYAVLHIEKSENNEKTTGNITIYSQQVVGSEVSNTVKGQIKSVSAQIKLKEYDISTEQIMQVLNPDLNFKTIQLGEDGKEKVSHTEALTGLAMICGVIIFMIILMFGIQIMRSIIEEKSSRIVEIIISSIKPMHLLLGKIVAIALVVLTQILIWIVVFGIIILIAQSQFSDIINQIQDYLQVVSFAKMLVCFILYLIFGYLLYASLFAIVGSGVDNEADTQQLQMIASVPLMIGYLIMFIVSAQPDNPLALWGSMIPFTSPIVMLARIPFGVSWFEIILSLAILAATFILFTWIAARIYRIGILMYGKKASFKEIIKWIKYKH